MNKNLSIEPIEKLPGHKGAVYSIVASQDENSFYTAGGNGMLLKWNLQNTYAAKLVAQIPSNVFTILPLEDRGIMLAGSLQGILYCFDLKKNRLFKELHFGKTIFDIKIYNDKIVVIDGTGKISLISMDDFSFTKQIVVSSKSIRSIDFSDKFVFGSSDSQIYLSDDLNPPFTKLSHHQGSVFSSIFLNKKTIIAGSMDAQMSIWKFDQKWYLHKNISAHLSTINSIALNPNKKIFATGSRDKSIKIWDAQNYKILKVINAEKYASPTASVNKLMWLNENILISGGDDRAIMIWNIN